MVAATRHDVENSNTLHDTFLAIVPKLQTHAEIAFRHITCSVTRADKIAECIALAWKWCKRLVERGKDINTFPMVFVCLVARAVKCGRRLSGMEKAKDVMNARCQMRNGFKVESSPSSTSTSHETLFGDVNGQKRLDAYEKRLVDNTQTPPDEQAAFRIDFHCWLQTLTGYERRIIREMALNHRTLDLAQQFDVSPGRISQLGVSLKLVGNATLATWHRRGEAARWQGGWRAAST